MKLPNNYYLWSKQNLPSFLKEKLKKMSETEIIDAFSDNLKFGTAGLRGLVGPGTNRINEITIAKATLAFLQYLQTQYSKTDLTNKGIVIAHDNRHYSTQFSQLAAEILASNKVKVFLFKNNELRPTPVLSFSIKNMKATAGIVITASHNPPEYNGFKIYNEHGAQYLPEVTNIIAENMTKLPDNFELSFHYNQELITSVPNFVEEEYKKAIMNLQFYPNQKRNIKIVFSNLHGTARDWVAPILGEAGYDVIIVKEQANFDPDFKGVASPNPEVKSSFKLAIEYAKNHNADLVILNDPDADRIGIAVRHQQDYVILNGNETAPILLEYLLSHYQQRNLMPVNPVMYNTFVSGTLSDAVAKYYGCEVIKTLTGFKWIAAEILKAKTNNQNFVFAFEEAYGYVIKDITLDKDGIQAAIVIAEACWYYAQQQLTLVEVLNNLYKKFGYYYCFTVNIVLLGSIGQKQIIDMLKTLRKTNINDLYSIKLIKKEDYLSGLYNMPSQNLLKYYFEDKSWFAVRPSGTEPKIKFYFVCVDENETKAKLKMQSMFQELAAKYLKIKVSKEMLNDN